MLNFALCMHIFTWLVACYFERETYEIHRNKGPLQLRLRLDKPATTEFNLQVYDLNDTANGELAISVCV